MVSLGTAAGSVHQSSGRGRGGHDADWDGGGASLRHARVFIRSCVCVFIRSLIRALVCVHICRLFFFRSQAAVTQLDNDAAAEQEDAQIMANLRSLVNLPSYLHEVAEAQSANASIEAGRLRAAFAQSEPPNSVRC